MLRMHGDGAEPPPPEGRVIGAAIFLPPGSFQVRDCSSLYPSTTLAAVNPIRNARCAPTMCLRAATRFQPAGVITTADRSASPEDPDRHHRRWWPGRAASAGGGRRPQVRPPRINAAHPTINTERPCWTQGRDGCSPLERRRPASRTVCRPWTCAQPNVAAGDISVEGARCWMGEHYCGAGALGRRQFSTSGPAGIPVREGCWHWLFYSEARQQLEPPGGRRYISARRRGWLPSAFRRPASRPQSLEQVGGWAAS